MCVSGCPPSPVAGSPNFKVCLLRRHGPPPSRFKPTVSATPFDFNRSAIRTDAATQLAELALILRKKAEGEVLVIGHTDSIGSDEANQKLSGARASLRTRSWCGEGCSTGKELSTKLRSSCAFPTRCHRHVGNLRHVGIPPQPMGPFYCPADRKAYIDLAFYRELAERGPPRPPGAALLEPGDLEEGLAAAVAIGDDRLQRRAQGKIVLETWTYGSSAQRVRWFRTSCESGSIHSCDTAGG